MNIPAQNIDYSPFPVFRPEDNPFESIIADVTHRCNMARDWSEGADGIIDPENMNRGRITQDFMLAPAMEHIKENEFGY